LFSFSYDNNDSKIKLSIINIINVNKKNPEVFDLFEVSFNLNKHYENPFDPDKIEINACFIQPDLTKKIVPCFWYEGYNRRLERGRELLTFNGDSFWKLRFTPTQTGRYQYYIEAKDYVDNIILRYPQNGYNNFTAEGTNRKGFLKISDRDKHYLEYSNGNFFLGYGHNLCGWEWPGRFDSEAWNGTDNLKGTYEYDEWLEKMFENNANLCQFDFCEKDQIEWTNNPGEFDFSNEWKGLTWFNQKQSWKMDYIFKRAEEKEIYFRLTLLHWEDFDDENEESPNWGWNRNPYNVKNGGPVKNVSLFFKDIKAINIYKKQLRYIIARWGYCKNIIAFELWNEIDSPKILWGTGNYTSNKKNILNWHREIAQYLKAIDPNKHLITTSFADSFNDPDIWNLENIDFTTIHRYTFYNPSYGDTQFSTINTINKIINERYKSVKKPVVIGEFSLTPGGDLQRLYDKDGVAFHNQSWASIMSKGAVTAMHWTWASYIHKNNLYYHYKPLSLFFHNEDLRDMKVFNNLKEASTKINYMILQKSDKAYIWIQDKKHNYVNIKTGYKPVLIKGSSIRLNDIDIGKYYIEYFNTYNGSIISKSKYDCKNKIIILDIPDFIKDIAVKIKKM